jgi:hypothetical protein
VKRFSGSIIPLRMAVDRFLRGEALALSEILVAVFALNNEIGPSLRRGETPNLRELQLRINELTKAAKSGDTDLLARAITRVEESARAIDEAATG